MTDQIPEVWVTHNFDRKHRKGEPCARCERIDGRARQSTMPSVTTCDKCGLTYYQTSAPHVCAEWTKGRTEHEPVARGGEGEHSPLPWSVGRNDRIEAASGRVIADMTFSSHSAKHGPANAALIVTAVNQHHSLLAERDGLRDTLGRILIDYERALKAWHVAANHSRTEFAHCLIVGCQEGQSTISVLRAALNDQKGVTSADQKGGEG